jgi:hypothetical protein
MAGGGILHERSRTIVTLETVVTHVPGHELHPCSRLHRGQGLHRFPGCDNVRGLGNLRPVLTVTRWRLVLSA